jgi:hypothetical protein
MSYSAQAGWPEVRIGDVLTYLDERIDLDDAAEYITITVKRRHGGLEEREHLFGHQIQTKKQFRLIHHVTHPMLAPSLRDRSRRCSTEHDRE